MERYEIAVIGTGPAGLEAAITARIRNKKTILFGSRRVTAKAQKAHTVQNYLGLPDVSGGELAAAFERHLDAMNIAVTEDTIHLAFAAGECFMLQGNGTEYEADTVILATGVNAARLYPGEEEFLGRGVSYCATCDAMLYRGKTVAVIGFSAREEAEAAFLAEVAGKVYYLPMYTGKVQIQSDAGEGVGDEGVSGKGVSGKGVPGRTGKIEVIRETPSAIEGTMKVNHLVTDRGRYEVDGVFILRESVSPSHLVPGLLLEDNHIKTDRRMRTNIPGCFACGDAAGPPYQYIKAAGEGNVAALSAVSYLADRR